MVRSHRHACASPSLGPIERLRQSCRLVAKGTSVADERHDVRKVAAASGPSVSSRPAARALRAAESFGNAAAAIGTITPGLGLFLVTRGQFSMLDMVQHVLREIGPAECSVWTWAIADYEVEAMAALMGHAAITGARLVVDRSAEQRSAATIQAWRDRFGVEAVRVCKNHAKIARVWNADFRVLLRGSMNLNFNPRFEQADITEGGEDFTLVELIEAELPVLPPLCSNAAADTASGLSLGFERSTLPMFQGLKAWTR